MKVALVHDWFVSLGGAEQVFRQIRMCYPDADIYCLIDFLSKEDREYILNGKKTNRSFLQRIPLIKKWYRYLFPFFKTAIEKFDLSEYDLIISSSHSVAKGIVVKPHQHHICYCHTPVRYAWDLRKEYLSQIPLPLVRNLVSWQLDKLKTWDLKATERVNHFIANSNFIADRILNNYGRESTVIYPPVNTKLFKPCQDSEHELPEDEKYVIAVSRMVPYKKIDLIIKSFNKLPQYKLKIVGEGPQMNYLKSISNDNIEILGFRPFEELVQLICKSRALILAAYEDFGITSIEAQACGVPVIALNKGGYLESIIEGETGVFYEDQSVDALLHGIKTFLDKETGFKREYIRENAEKFEETHFRENLVNYVNEKVLS